MAKKGKKSSEAKARSIAKEVFSLGIGCADAMGCRDWEDSLWIVSEGAGSFGELRICVCTSAERSIAGYPPKSVTVEFRRQSVCRVAADPSGKDGAFEVLQKLVDDAKCELLVWMEEVTRKLYGTTA